MNYLQTGICHLFETIASSIWDKISINNKRGLSITEESITRNDVISEIQNFTDSNEYFNVFAQKSKKEVITGSDLEIYIEVGNRKFVRILLQAKILKPNNKFETLNKKSGSSDQFQFDTLEKYSNSINSESFFIFFTGIPFYKKNDFRDCKGLHDEKQFGCSLLTNQEIKELNNFGTASSYKINTPIGKPWRMLTCCYNSNLNSRKTYSPNEIDADPYFKKIFDRDWSNFKGVSDNVLQNIVEDNRYLHNQGWNPSNRIILAENMKMDKENNIIKFINNY